MVAARDQPQNPHLVTASAQRPLDGCEDAADSPLSILTVVLGSDFSQPALNVMEPEVVGNSDRS